MKCLTILLLLFSSDLIFPQIDSYSKECVLKFAEHLFYNEKDYARALSEYKRFQFLTDTFTDSIQFKVGICFKRLNEYNFASAEFEKVAINSNSVLWKQKALFEQAQINFLEKNFELSNQQLNKINTDESSININLKYKFLSLLNYLSSFNFNETDKLIQDKPISSGLYDFNDISALAEIGKSLPRKSELLGGCLSAVIPGSGKIYTGDWGDGIYSFLVTSVCAYQSFDGFNNHGIKSGKGWIFATLTAIFYAGNIYGSVNSAKAYNYRVENEYLNSIQELAKFTFEIDY